MPELEPKMTRELVVTPSNRPARQYEHSAQWAQDTLRAFLPQASSTVTPEGVMIVQVPTTLSAQTVQDVLGHNFYVVDNRPLQY
jgi:hypothetical protein